MIVLFVILQNSGTVIDGKNIIIMFEFIEETNILINLCDDYIHTKLNIHFFRFLPEQVDG